MPDDPYPADSTDYGTRVKASPRRCSMNFRGGAAAVLLVGLAATAGWAGHRVYHRVSRVLAARAAAGPRPESPLARADRRAYAWVPAAPHALGDPASGTPPRVFQWAGGWLGRAEVTAGAFAEFLNETRNESFASPQFVREGPAWQAIRPDHPVIHVNLADARAYAQWFSARKRVRARLPSADEWEAAARGGVAGAPYAWGWGDPSGRAAFAASGTVRTAWFPANGFGLFDCSGGVAEWCEPAADDPPGTAVVRGGSWSDRDPAQLQPGRMHRLPATYRDADVGFRILIEPAPAAGQSSR